MSMYRLVLANEASPFHSVVRTGRPSFALDRRWLWHPLHCTVSCSRLLTASLAALHIVSWVSQGLSFFLCVTLTLQVLQSPRTGAPPTPHHWRHYCPTCAALPLGSERFEGVSGVAEYQYTFWMSRGARGRVQRSYLPHLSAA